MGVWIRNAKTRGLNISNLISKEVPKSAGQKGSTSRRKGAPKGKKKEDVLTERSFNSPPTTSFPLGSVGFSTPSSPYPLLSNPPPDLQYRSMFGFSPATTNHNLSSPPSSSFERPYSNPSVSYYASPLPAPCVTSYYNQPVYNFYSPPQPLDNLSSPSCQPVFNIKHLGGTQIRSCYGCGNPIRKDLFVYHHLHMILLFATRNVDTIVIQLPRRCD